MEINDVSGRGVGMGAIKRFIDEKGGVVEVILDQSGQRVDHVSFRITMKLPSHLWFKPT